jgi:hypothetical protein
MESSVNEVVGTHKSGTIRHVMIREISREAGVGAPGEATTVP